MTHPEEHILELHVLGDPGVTGRRDEIAAHLLMCEGCRALTESMRVFHADLRRELEPGPGPVVGSGAPIARRATEFVGRYTAGALMRPAGPITIRERVGYLVRRHPVVTGAFSLLGVAALALLFLRRDEIADARVNEPSSRFEALNARSEVLWSIPVSEPASIKEEEQSRGFRHLVLDVTGDGSPEIISSLPLEENGRRVPPVITIYDRLGDTIRRFPFHRDLRFNDKLYANEPWGASYLLAEDYDGDGKKELLTLEGCGRSPSALLRYDLDGHLLGEYWHYGSFSALYAMERDGKKIVLLCGLSDVEEPALSYPVIVAIDPARLVGVTESHATPGFGFAPSKAELSYARFPLVSLNGLFHVNAAISNIAFRGEYLQADHSFSGERNVLDYYVTLTRDLVPVDLHLSTVLMQTYARLVKEGKVPASAESSDKELLLTGMRYLDGRAWVTHPVWGDSALTRVATP